MLWQLFFSSRWAASGLPAIHVLGHIDLNSTSLIVNITVDTNTDDLLMLYHVYLYRRELKLRRLCERGPDPPMLNLELVQLVHTPIDKT
jgi:hypothetical protein